MARRVVQASNAAVPWPAAISPYHIFLWRGVSYDSVVGAFTGVFKTGSMAGTATPDPGSSSSSAFDAINVFGRGVSGLACSVSFAGSAAAADSSSMAEGASAIRGVSAERVVQQERSRAAIINDHLSHCRPGEGAGLSATALNLLYQRTGVTGPLVTFSLVPSSRSETLPSWSLRTRLFPGTPHVARKNCYNPARQLFPERPEATCPLLTLLRQNVHVSRNTARNLRVSS